MTSTRSCSARSRAAPQRYLSATPTSHRACSSCPGQLRRGTRLPLPQVTGHVPAARSQRRSVAFAMVLFEARLLCCCSLFRSPILHMYVSSVSDVSDVCCNCFILMLQKYIEEYCTCCKCFRSMLQAFIQNVSFVSRHMLQSFF
jgi:hypothetical protein